MKMNVKKPSTEEISLTVSWGTWEKEPSEFPWVYDDKETCYILEGKAEVTDKEGNIVSFEAGDWVTFDKGVECTWKISETINKKYKFG